MKFMIKISSMVLITLSILSGCSDKNIPSDAILAETLEKQLLGTKLDSINLKETNSLGNRKIYLVMGKLHSTQDLYDLVTSIGDHFIVEKTWESRNKIDFTATLNALGSKDSGWKLEFSDLKLSKTPRGDMIPNIQNPKYLIVGSKALKEKLDVIAKEYQVKTARRDEFAGKFMTLDEEVRKINEKIKSYWGEKSTKGYYLERRHVEATMNEELHKYQRENNPYFFERKYHDEVYTPERRAREQELRNYSNKDFKDLDDKKRAVIAEYKKNFEEASNNIKNKISAEMKKLDDRLLELNKQKEDVNSRKNVLQRSLEKIANDVNQWEEAVKILISRGI